MPRMKPAMYIFINRGLGMSPGKIAAQAGHAAVEAALLSHPSLPQRDMMPYGSTNDDFYTVHEDVERLVDLWAKWREGLHYAKYVMEARDTEHLRSIERYLEDRGFSRTAMIIDEGHTEIDPIQPTALGVALVDKDDPHTEATFSSFNLYREPSPARAYKDGIKDGKRIERFSQDVPEAEKPEPQYKSTLVGRFLSWANAPH